jgi:glycosyltransferase involved in cell wall biosynthesis
LVLRSGSREGSIVEIHISLFYGERSRNVILKTLQSPSRPESERLSVVHVITDLDVGGVEVNLLRLIETTRGRITHAVISLRSGGALESQMRDLGVPVESLYVRPESPNPIALWRCRVKLQAFHPHLVHTWMYHANLVGGIAACMAGIPIQVWGIHHTQPTSGMGLRTRLTVWAGALVASRLPQVIICGAHSTRTLHARLGYPDEKMTVILNGYDVATFSPDAKAGARLREELGIPTQAFVFGMVARVHPDKDPENFVAAVREVLGEDPNVRFLWCGEGAHIENRSLKVLLDDYGVAGKIHLIGARQDMPYVYNAMDVLVCSSRSEALPNTIGEAMACAKPCVATDVGDVAYLLGDTGRIVPARDPQALARAMLELRRMSSAERWSLGRRSRQRIASQFDLAGFAREHIELYRGLAAR